MWNYDVLHILCCHGDTSSETFCEIIAGSPDSTVTFVSELYPGRTSDRNITKHCGILQLLEEGDSIMADRGFEILDDLPKGVTLNIPGC